MTEDVKTKFKQLLENHSYDLRIHTEGDAINSQNMEMPEAPFENSDPRLISRIQDALAAERQVAVVAAGATKVLVIISKQGTKLFDGPPGTELSPYKALVVQGHAAIMEGTQAKLNGNHEKGKALYQSALTSFLQAQKMRPDEAAPKLGIAEASSHLWESEDPTSVIQIVKAAEQLLEKGLSEDRINKFDGKDVVQFQYAMCNLAMKKRDAAKENLRKVLAINPGHRFAGGILKRVEEEDSKKGGCFIATAAFSSSLTPEVRYLRAFRDDVLLRSPAGRMFVDTYYRWSPAIAKVITRHGWMKVIVRHLLVPTILGLKVLRREKRG